MVNQSKSRAWLVLRAAIRMKVLMEAKRKRDEEEREAAVEAAEAGDSHTPLLGGSPGSQYTHMTAHSFSRVSIAESIAKTVDHQVKWWLHDLATIQEILMSSWVNLLLVCIPLGFCAGFLKWDAIAVFTLNFLSLIPLALVLGDVTEDLALRYGSTVGGLINATFGNVVEVILSLSALNKGLYQVVATSLLGSILSNLLLVTGCSFFFGGLLYRNQTFNKAGNQVCSSLLFLAALGFLFPTAASTMVSDPDAAADWTLHLSRYTAIILLIMYACYLVMQLHTHKDLFADEDDDDAEPMLSLVASLGMLVIITACVTVHSEFLTSTIEDFSKQSGVNTLFLSMIVLPIAGNACEHMTAVLVAMKNKMDLSMGVAVGSSIQIALFALPLTVMVGWAIGRPMSLSFDQFSALALTVAVVQSHFVTSGGRSHWMMGVQLIALYSLIAVAFLER